jgi:osmoprotectant transport system permease protein
VSNLEGLSGTNSVAQTTDPLPPQRGNRLLGTLVIVMGLALAFGGFLAVSPNRILTGKAVSLFAALPPAVWATVLLTLAALALLAVVRPARGGDALVVALGAVLFFNTLWAAGYAATLALADRGPAARAALGPAFWVLTVASLLCVVDAVARLRLGISGRMLLFGAFVGGLVLILSMGALHDLSIAREFANRRSAYAGALTTHVLLTATTLALALPLGALLGLLALRRRHSAPALFAVLNLVQTIPSVALFALLIAPLTLLSSAMPALRDWGISGIGAAPAIIALTLYALLPVARGVVTGIGQVPAAVIDTARGMGMTRQQILWQVSLPLAMPVLLATVRLVLVQTIGLTVVAALIGAGGLGSFVFQGLGQTATDLVLLGALSAIGLALLADFVLRLLTEALAPQQEAR